LPARNRRELVVLQFYTVNGTCRFLREREREREREKEKEREKFVVH